MKKTQITDLKKTGNGKRMCNQSSHNFGKFNVSLELFTFLQTYNKL